MKNVDMVANERGIMVKKCCASCAHKCYANDEYRCCQLTGTPIRAKHKCKEWKMSDDLRTLGYRDGRVQKRTYLLFVMDVRARELEAEEQGVVMEPMTVESMRRAFELLHGSRIEIG